MSRTNIYPNKNFTDNSFVPHVSTHLLDTGKSVGAVLICPGGGYHHLAVNEQDNIAMSFNRSGLHAFVLNYRVLPYHHPAPANDLSRAIRIIRHNAKTWKVRPDKIAVCGFSAGGHLAATLGVHHDRFGTDNDDIDREPSRPDALILNYPVITSGDFCCRGAFRNLLGTEKPAEEDLEFLSVEKHVNGKTPPSFLWHTADDPVVHVKNSILFSRALSENKIPFELHIYSHGRHGLNLASEDPHIATWFNLCCEWLRKMGWF